MSTYLGVKLNRVVTYHHLQALHKKLSVCVLLLRQLAGSGWSAGAKTLRTAGVVAHILTSLTVLLMMLCALSLDAYIPPQRTTFQFYQASSKLSFAAKEQYSPWLSCSLDPSHILHGQLTEQQAASKERLKSRHLFVPAIQKLLHNLSELGVRAAQWMNLTWDTEYSKSMLVLGVYISRVSTRPIKMSLTRTAWV